jgi:hypothetical protein
LNIKFELESNFTLRSVTQSVIPFKDSPLVHVTQYFEIRQYLRDKLRKITPNE